MSDDARARRARLSAAQQELLRQRLRGGAAPAAAAIPPAPRNAGLPLSSAQERLWFLDRLGLGAAYNMTQVVRLRGPLDAHLLQASLDAVVARHEVLRTIYTETDGTPSQRVLAPRSLPLERVECAHLGADESAHEVRRHWERESRLPFRLSDEDGGPLRVTLLQTAEADHALLLTLHHIAGDDWSQRILLSELLSIYHAGGVASSASLPALTVQYADYAAWQRQRLDSERIESQLAYWKAKLEGLSTLDLPLDAARPTLQTFAGGSCDFALTSELAARIVAVQRDHGVTGATLLLAAFSVLLSRYSGQLDVAVGAPVANRPLPELEPLIGLFVSTVVMRTELGGDPTFAELLRRTHQTTVEAQEHQDLPFERLVDALGIERDLSRNPLFQVLFAMMAEPQGLAPQAARTLEAPAAETYELEVLPYALDSAITRFDLELNVRASAAGIAGRFCFNTDLFARSTIERMAQHYVALLDELTAAPHARLSELPCMDAAERRRVVVEWNATACDFGDERLAHELFEDQVERQPSALALVFETDALSYAELNERSNRLAHHLRARGVGPDVLVGLCLERGVELVVGLLAILKAGGAYLPIDPEAPMERVALLVEDAGLKLLVSEPAVRERLEQDGLRLGAAAQFVLLPSNGTGDGTDDGADDGAQSAANPAPLGTEGRLAYAIYTSGSTGRPKGVMIAHAALRNRLLWMQSAYGLDASDAVLQKTPFTFDVSVWEFLWPLAVGARLVMARPGGHRDPLYVASAIERYDVTTVHFVPSMLRALLELPDLSSVQGLRRVICSGEELPADLRDECLRRTPAELHNLYGPTEAAIDVTAAACRAGEPGASVAIGRPIANTTVYVLDERMEPVPLGAAGELYLGGVQLARGYLGRPDLTAERFVPDPFWLESRVPAADGASPSGSGRLYRTGDRARWRSDGVLEFLGRLDQQIKLRGYRIEPGEIEAVLRSETRVRDAVVLPWTDAQGELRLVGYVVLDEPGEAPGDVSGAGSATDSDRAQAELAALRPRLAAQLPSYMIPAVLMPLAALPLTSNGKLDRRALPEPALGQEARAEYVAPKGPIECELAEIWSELLPVDRVGAQESFFDLGGHSLLATRLVARVRSHFGIELPLRAIFDHPTVSALALELLRAMLAEEEGELA